MQTEPSEPVLTGSLSGRTIQEVPDLSTDEQLYLFERARRLKAKSSESVEGKDAPPLAKVEDSDIPDKVELPDSTVYLLFMEGSTRTRESFRNAAIFHGVKVNEFQAETSSFQKNETITDTMKMLAVYSTDRSVFVIRSPLEGVCTWLQTALPAHAEKFGIPKPAFLNAGDGRHTHPVAELVDIYSMLEHRAWDRSSIHIALVGDLAHGRTAHTKVDGLSIFGRVRVDLIAPDVFAYPIEYRNKMWEQGFQVRVFDSVESYLKDATGSIAGLWYFYQPQFKRCGDLTQTALNELRSNVTFRSEWKSRLPAGVCFFQTLPRDKENPLIPLSFDTTPINGWDRVSSNAYFVDCVLLSLLFGQIGHGLPKQEPESPKTLSLLQKSNTADADAIDKEAAACCPFLPREEGEEWRPLPSFIEEVDLNSKRRKASVRRPERARSGGTVPIKDGLVVDHVGVSRDGAVCWSKLRTVRTIMAWSKFIGSEGVYTSGKDGAVSKGILSLPNFEFESLTVSELKILASIAPGCTVNAVRASTVIGKYRLSIPERIYNLPNIHCKNPLCVSHPDNKQRDVVAYFARVPFFESSVLPMTRKSDEFLFVCKYCKHPHHYEDIWADAVMGRPI